MLLAALRRDPGKGRASRISDGTRRTPGSGHWASPANSDVCLTIKTTLKVLLRQMRVLLAVAMVSYGSRPTRSGREPLEWQTVGALRQNWYRSGRKGRKRSRNGVHVGRANRPHRMPNKRLDYIDTSKGRETAGCRMCVEARADSLARFALAALKLENCQVALFLITI